MHVKFWSIYYILTKNAISVYKWFPPLSFNFSVKNFIFSHTLICVHLWTRDSQFVMYLLFCFHFLAHNKIRHQTAEEKCFFLRKHQTYGINKLDWVFSFILVPVFPLCGCFEFIFHLLPYFSIYRVIPGVLYIRPLSISWLPEKIFRCDFFKLGRLDVHQTKWLFLKILLKAWTHK